MDKEILLKWKKSGLLFGLLDGYEIAQLFEDMSSYAKTMGNQDFDNLLLPSVTRIFRNEKFKGQIEIEKLYSLIKESWYDFSSITKKYFPHVDVELIFVTTIMEEYIKG